MMHPYSILHAVPLLMASA